MILLREIQERDLEALERFAQIPGFINLPNDRDLLKERITKSINSFGDKGSFRADGKFIFVAEDLETKQVLGTSMIASQHGSTESPHFYFEVGSEKKFSAMINTGFIHGTLKLKYDSNGPSEIGGLVLDPLYRDSKARIGRQIAFVRFLFLGLNRPKFKRKVIAELLPPLNKKGQSPLWESIGRRFTNMDYWEADELCRKNKEFIFSLFPTGKIYTTFFSAEARNAIGKVGKETEPVLHMLKKIGFQYKNHIDPFDGGPHLWASADDILPVKKITQKTLVTKSAPFKKHSMEQGLISKINQSPGEFRAMAIQAEICDGHLKIREPEEELIKAGLGINFDEVVIFMPYY
jgi:arginine N-succinyltransferase